MDNAQRAIAALREAADIMEQRAAQYNGQGDLFPRICKIVHHNTDRESMQNIFSVHIATKLARMEVNPAHHDSLIDYIAYVAISVCNRFPEA